MWGECGEFEEQQGGGGALQCPASTPSAASDPQWNQDSLGGVGGEKGGWGSGLHLILLHRHLFSLEGGCMCMCVWLGGGGRRNRIQGSVLHSSAHPAGDAGCGPREVAHIAAQREAPA